MIDQTRQVRQEALFAPMSRMHGYAAVMLASGLLLVSWRFLYQPVAVPEQTGWIVRALVGVALNVGVIIIVMRWFASVPKADLDVSAHTAELARLSAQLEVVPPKLVGHRSTPGVFLRGLGSNASIVIGTQLSVLWSQRPDLREAMLAHELGHLKARDQYLFFGVKAISTIALFEFVGLLIDSAFRGNDSGLIFPLLKVLLTGSLVALVSRAYIRYREHVADVEAFFLLDKVKALREAVTQAPDQTRIGRLLGTHPTGENRKAIIFNFTLLMREGLLTYLMLGLAAGFFTAAVAIFSALPLEAAGSPIDPVILGIVTTVVAIVALFARNLLIQFVFHNTSMRSIFARLATMFAAAMIGLLLLDPLREVGRIRIDYEDVAILAGVVIGAALMCTLSCIYALLKSKDGSVHISGHIVLVTVLTTSMTSTLYAAVLCTLR